MSCRAPGNSGEIHNQPADRVRDDLHIQPVGRVLAGIEGRSRPEAMPVTLAGSNVGPLGGLVALRDGLCHLAGSHPLDPAAGEYTLPYVKKLLGGEDIAVARLVHRDQ